MSTPSKTLRQVEDTLISVIESLIDGQEGFQKIGDELKDETLRLYFLEESLNRIGRPGGKVSVMAASGFCTADPNLALDSF